MSLGKRIAAARRQKKLTQEALGRIVGVGQSTVTEWEKDRNEPSISVIEKIARATGENLHWIAFGRKQEVSGDSVLEIAVRGGLGGGGIISAERVTADEFGNTMNEDPTVGVWTFPSGYLSRELRVSIGGVRIIEVEGDSMEPTLLSGDRVMIDTKRLAPSPPGLFAIHDGIGIVVKRLDYILGSDPPAVEVISDNDKHKRVSRTLDEVRIVGRVVWFARRV